MGYLTYIGSASPYYTSVTVGNVVTGVSAVPGQTQHFDDAVSAALLAAQPTLWATATGLPDSPGDVIPSAVVGGNAYLSLQSFNGTSDGTRINALLAELDGGPGTIFLPFGTLGNPGIGVLDEPVILASGQFLVSFNPFACILQAAPGLNAHMIQSVNFATLTGTDTTSTPANLGVVGVGIDGNKANNTSGRGVALYASNVRLQNFFIRNTAGIGLWTEWGSASAAIQGTEAMESFVSNFKIHDCQGETNVSIHGVTSNAAGWCFLGPHDSQANDGIFFYNGTDSASVHQGMANLEIPAGSFGNGATFDNLHLYGGQTDYGIRNVGSGITFGQRVQVEGARIAEMYLNGSSTTRVFSKLFSGGVSTAAVKGLKVDAGASAVTGLVKIENCGGGVIDWTGSGGDHWLTVHATHTTQAPPFPANVGTPGSNSRIEYLITDTSGVTTSDTIVSLTGRITAEGGTLVPREYWLNGANNNVRRSIPRAGFAAADTNPLSTGVLYLVAVELIRSDVVTNLTFKSHTTAAGTPAHWWFALYDSGFNLLGQTADQLTASWGTFTAKKLALTSPYTVPASGVYYAAIMVAAATPPTLDGVSGSANGTSANAYVTGETLIAGTFGSALTTTAPSSAATPTASGITVMAVTS